MTRDPRAAARRGGGADGPRQRRHAHGRVRHRRLHRRLDPRPRAGRDGRARAWIRARAARPWTPRSRTSREGVFAAGNLLHGAEPADVAALSGRHAARRGRPLRARRRVAGRARADRVRAAARLDRAERAWRGARGAPPPRALRCSARASSSRGAADRDRPGRARRSGTAASAARAGPLGEAAQRAGPPRSDPAAGPCACGSSIAGKGRAWSTRSRPTAWREDADKLEQHSEQLGERIDEVEDEWERKEQDASVPGAQPDADDENGAKREGRDGDARSVGPAARGGPGSRDATTTTRGEHGTDNPGVPGEDETGTGNPDAAGARRRLAHHDSRHVHPLPSGRGPVRGPIKAGWRRCSPSACCCCSSTRRRSNGAEGMLRLRRRRRWCSRWASRGPSSR